LTIALAHKMAAQPEQSSWAVLVKRSSGQCNIDQVEVFHESQNSMIFSKILVTKMTPHGTFFAEFAINEPRY